MGRSAPGVRDFWELARKAKTDVASSTHDPKSSGSSAEFRIFQMTVCGEAKLRHGASQALWPAAFKIRLVISLRCEIRDR